MLAACRAEGGQADVHPIPRAALVWIDDTVRWLGPERDLPTRHASLESIDAGGRLVVPGLVDCHTHLAFGGWRADEFEQRVLGRSYEAIAAAGGGIQSTVRATRASTQETLVARAMQFLEAMAALGITTVECKSGYGLSVDDEVALLRVYRAAAHQSLVALSPTLLAAHALPPEYADRRGEYIDLVTEELIPTVAQARLAESCDVFVERGAFTIAEGRRILDAGRLAGMAARVHADQLSPMGGAELAADVGAWSADHLEHITDRGIRALAAAHVVAVSLPIATLYLGQPPLPARALIDAGVHVAVATDFNPGSAPSYHLPLAMLLACTLQHMSPAEALKGATIYAAQALGRANRIGSLEPGKEATFAVMDADDVTQWIYHFRPNACVTTVIGGQVAWRAP
jgi:imidazolonepropionase